MKEIIIDIKDLKNSKEIYSSKPNPYLSGFVYILLALFLVSIIYASFAKIDIYVTASGMIRPNDDVSTVTNLMSGRVVQVNVIDGQLVNKGDVLIKIDSSELEISLRELKESQKECRSKIEMYNKYLTGINDGVNPFSDEIEGEEYYYYISYLNYELAKKNNEQQYLYDKNINIVNIQNLNTRINSITKDISGLEAYKKSVEQGQNLCDEYPEYANMYLLYEASINTLKSEYVSGRTDMTNDSTIESNKVYLDYYNEQLEGYNKLIDSIYSGISKFEEADNSTYALMFKEYLLTKAEYEKKYKDNPEDLDIAITSYKNSLLKQYEAARDEIKAKRDNLAVQLDNASNTNNKLNSYDSSYGNAINSKYYQTITQIEASIDSLKQEKETAYNNLKIYKILQEKYDASVDEKGEPLILSIPTVEKTIEVLNNLETYEIQENDIETKIEQLEKQISDCSIIAEKTGTVNMISSMVVGDLISSGNTIATIIPPSESEYKVQMYVNNSDIASIEEGEIIKYNIDALPYNQYGVVEGRVNKISTDTLIQNGEYSGYYLIEGSISNEQLEDKDGNIGNIGIGMQVRAKIVTQRKTIMRYLIEKISLF